MPTPPLLQHYASLRALACAYTTLLTVQASLAHSALFAGFYTFLSGNVAYRRAQSGITDADENKNDEGLKRAARAHGNFVEYTPFAFGLLFLAELNGAPTAWVHAGYLSLFALRVSHFFGIQYPTKSMICRKVGFLGTLAVVLGAGLYNVRISCTNMKLGLGWEPLKSFLRVHHHH